MPYSRSELQSKFSQRAGLDGMVLKEEVKKERKVEGGGDGGREVEGEVRERNILLCVCSIPHLIFTHVLEDDITVVVLICTGMLVGPFNRQN